MIFFYNFKALIKSHYNNRLFSTALLVIIEMSSLKRRGRGKKEPGLTEEGKRVKNSENPKSMVS